jgi:hypothetical protein
MPPATRQPEAPLFIVAESSEDYFPRTDGGDGFDLLSEPAGESAFALMCSQEPDGTFSDIGAVSAALGCGEMTLRPVVTAAAALVRTGGAPDISLFLTSLAVRELLRGDSGRDTVFKIKKCASAERKIRYALARFSAEKKRLFHRLVSFVFQHRICGRWCDPLLKTQTADGFFGADAVAVIREAFFNPRRMEALSADGEILFDMESERPLFDFGEAFVTAESLFPGNPWRLIITALALRLIQDDSRSLVRAATREAAERAFEWLSSALSRAGACEAARLNRAVISAATALLQNSGASRA